MYVSSQPPTCSWPVLMQSSSANWLPQPSGLAEPSLLNAQLQFQLGQQAPQQHQLYPANRSADVLQRAQASRFPDIPHQLPYDIVESQVPPMDPATWPPMQGSIPRLHAAARCLPYSGDYNSLGVEEGGNTARGLVPIGLSTMHNSPQEVALQNLALVRLRKENARLQTELGRSEREIARQKGLRESERSEFNEARERLKHSWANDRDDFARVKSNLRMKNAEHHAHSGRISQHLKDVEACNRALREFIARSGLDVPIELEGPQIRRFVGQTSRSQFTQEVSTSRDSSEHTHELPSEQIEGAIDMYLRNTPSFGAQLPSSSAGSPDRLGASFMSGMRQGQYSPDRQTPRNHYSS